MAIIIAFFCGLCFYTLTDSVADYIYACAKILEAKAGALNVQNKLKELELDKAQKGDNTHGD